MNATLIECLLLLAHFANPAGSPAGLDTGLRALVVDYFDTEEMEGPPWLMEGIRHLLDRKRTPWTKIACEDAVFQDLQSLIIELEMLYPEAGFNIDDDGICIAIKPNRSQLSLVISRMGPQYRVV